MLVALTGASNGEPRPRSVLILEHSDPGLPHFIRLTAAFRSTLRERSPSPVAVYSENLDLSRFSGPQYEAQLRSFLEEKYRGKPLGSILAIGQGALEFALRQWPRSPIIFTSVDEQVVPRLNLPPNVTGLTARMGLQESVVAAKALVPGLRRLALIADHPERRTYARFLQREIPTLLAEFEIIELFGLTMKDLRERVANLPADAAILYLGVTTDGAGTDLLAADALRLIAEVANRPIIIDSDSQLGSGAAGGFVSDPVLVGQRAADLANQVLSGETTRIPTAPSNSRRPVFDERQLRRFNVSEASLPPGSEIRFRTPSLWEQYRKEAIGVLIVIVLQSALLVGLLIERRRRRIAQTESRQRFMEIAHLSRTASAGALSVSIAHELNQPLGAILSNTEAAETLLDEKNPDLTTIREILRDIRKADQRAGEIIRRLRGLLRKSAVQLVETDLNDAAADVLGIIRAEATNRGVLVDSALVESPLTVSADLIHLQQAMLNLALNGMDAMSECVAGNRRLRLETAVVGPSTAEVSVWDNGSGIPADKLKSIFEPFFTTKDHGMGLGLPIVRTIIETYGGKIWAENRAGGGTVFRFTIPLASARAA
jgi:signal transduction histidine kinase